MRTFKTARHRLESLLRRRKLESFCLSWKQEISSCQALRPARRNCYAKTGFGRCLSWSAEHALATGEASGFGVPRLCSLTQLCSSRLPRGTNRPLKIRPFLNKGVSPRLQSQIRVYFFYTMREGGEHMREGGEHMSITLLVSHGSAVCI